MKTKAKIMIVLNYMFAFCYIWMGSLGIIAGIAMLAEMSMDFLFNCVLNNKLYWIVVTMTVIMIGTKQNIGEGWFVLKD